MPESVTARPPGFVPASIAAGVAFASTAVYLILIVSEGNNDVLPVAGFAAFFGALGMCALIGGIRRGPDRVVWLGAASGGLIGVGVIAILSIGLLFLIAGLCALTAWMRASIGVPRRMQVLAACAGLGVPVVMAIVVFA